MEGDKTYAIDFVEAIHVELTDKAGELRWEVRRGAAAADRKLRYCA